MYVIPTALSTKTDDYFAVCLLSLSGQVHGVDELCLPFPDCGKLPFDEYQGSHTTGYLGKCVNNSKWKLFNNRTVEESRGVDCGNTNVYIARQ